MAKSVPFRSLLRVPHDIHEGMVLKFEHYGNSKVTKIKSVKFIDMRVMEVIGLCLPSEEKLND